MAVGYIKGVQAQDVAACVEPFAANNQGWARNTIDVEVDEHALREIYFPAFEAAVKEEGVLTFMGAYNRLRGQHASHNDYFLNQVLTKEWGLRGLVVSEWDATHDAREAALNGLDLEMGPERRAYDDFFLARQFRELLDAGVATEAQLDEKVRRILRVMFETRAFDGRSPGSINTKAHQDVARAPVVRSS